MGLWCIQLPLCGGCFMNFSLSHIPDWPLGQDNMVGAWLCFRLAFIFLWGLSTSTLWTFELNHCCGGCPVHCRIFSNKLGLYHLDASKTNPNLRQSRVSLEMPNLGRWAGREKNYPWVRTTELQPTRDVLSHIWKVHDCCYAAFATMTTASNMRVSVCQIWNEVHPQFVWFFSNAVRG